MPINQNKLNQIQLSADALLLQVLKEDHPADFEQFPMKEIAIKIAGGMLIETLNQIHVPEQATLEDAIEYLQKKYVK